jgi:two-component system sensor histidine kinase/response regulator
MWLRGDVTRLRQALLNYASNAVKFTECGRVTIRCRLVEDRGDELGALRSRRHRDRHRRRRDRAHCSGPFEQSRCFDHAQVRRHRARAGHHAPAGTLMGGDAGAESRPGEGSCFWFVRLAGARCTGRLRRTEGAGISAAELRRRHAGARILLVEDNPVNREVATELLQDAGLMVEVAENGRMERGQAARPSLHALVLMDMQMPEMDGLEATRASSAGCRGAATCRSSR